MKRQKKLTPVDYKALLDKYGIYQEAFIRLAAAITKTIRDHNLTKKQIETIVMATVRLLYSDDRCGTGK